MDEKYIDYLNGLTKMKILNQDPLRYILNNNILDDSGLVLEFGCWKGQTIDMISDFTSKNVYGFDTFEGVDYMWKGEVDMNKFKLDKIPDKVCKLDKFEQYKNTNIIKSFNKNVNFIKGLFEETLPIFLKNNKAPITFIHIDCDIYESTKTIFNLCGNRISDGCIIVFDELVNQKNYGDDEIKSFYEWTTFNDIKYEWLGSGSKILNLDEIKFLKNLKINKNCLDMKKFPRFNDNSEELFNDKMYMFNLKCQVAVKIVKNPKYLFI